MTTDLIACGDGDGKCDLVEHFFTPIFALKLPAEWLPDRNGPPTAGCRGGQTVKNGYFCDPLVRAGVVGCS